MSQECVHGFTEGCVRCAMDNPGWVKPVVLAVFVVDDSGSMKPRLTATIAGLNENLDSLRNVEEVDYRVTIAAFASSSRIIIANANPKNVPQITREHLKGSGSTALIQTVWETLATTKAALAKEPSATVLFYVISDGEDTDGGRSRADVNKLVGELEKEKKWTFSFIGCDIDTWSSPDRTMLGKSVLSNTVSANASNYADTWKGLRSATRNYTHARVASRTMSMSRGIAPEQEEFVMNNLYEGTEVESISSSTPKTSDNNTP